MSVKNLSTYYLIYELLHDGKGHIHPDIEPIDILTLVAALEQRAGATFGGDVNQWVNWFLTADGVATEKEKSDIATVRRIRDIEKRSLSRLPGSQ